MEQIRKIVFFKTYFFEFFELQDQKVKEKIDFGLFLLQYVKQVPSKHIGSTQKKIYFICGLNKGQTFIGYSFVMMKIKL